MSENPITDGSAEALSTNPTGSDATIDYSIVNSRNSHETQNVGEGLVVAAPDVARSRPGGSFDPIHPPSAKLIAECVHCGFCLPSCPTYQLWGEEMDSPRGRIDLMRQALEGKVTLDSSFASHIDACLGCMACMTACPSGVQYDQLIEATRAQIERNVPRSSGDKAFRELIFWLFPYRERLRRAALLGLLIKRSGLTRLLDKSGVSKFLPARLAVLQELLPELSFRELVRAKRTVSDSKLKTSSSGIKVGLQTGCIAPIFFDQVHQATIRVLDAEGIEVVIPEKQGCCGALSQHAGQANSTEFAKAMISVWDSTDVDFVVTNAAGCGSALKDYAKLLADDPIWAERADAFSSKVKDIMELLAEIPEVAPRHSINKKVAYHDACHLAHAQRVRQEPRNVLATIPGLQLLDIPDGDTCCGSAGIYNLLFTEAAIDLGVKKAINIESVKPDIIAAGNPGCLIQIERFLEDGTVLVHPVQLLDASIRNDESALVKNAKLNKPGSKHKDLRLPIYETRSAVRSSPPQARVTPRSRKDSSKIKPPTIKPQILKNGNQTERDKNEISN